jgi:hypothetical protein
MPESVFIPERCIAMKLGTLVLLLVLAVIAGFTFLNWSVFLLPTTLSIGVAEVQAPLGLILLGALVLLAALFLVYVLYLQATVMRDTRRHSKELQTHRKLSDQAEASRFTELRNFLEAEFKRMTAADNEAKAALLARVDKLEHDLRLAIEQSGNSVAASVAEMDDRLQASGAAQR